MKPYMPLLFAFISGFLVGVAWMLNKFGAALDACR